MIHVIERTSSGPTLLVKSDAIIPAHYLITRLPKRNKAIFFSKLTFGIALALAMFQICLSMAAALQACVELQTKRNEL
ncbi:hypothetical protein C2W62_21800 [Candidatus Entotheonella serta]|nr:hypothetical protein C2W62_21800 [Candidatus Entotheonella serta]